MRSRKCFAAFTFVVLVVALVTQGEARAQSVPQQTCGNEGERPCTATKFTARCDTGLKNSPQICGCTLPGLFGKCAIPKLCPTCMNYTRRRSSLNGYADSWVDWALHNQRELARDEPLNWVMHLGTHNSFNTYSDGHSVENFPNQFYSITDQLRTGARVLTLDLYKLAGEVRVCHSASADTAREFCVPLGDQTIYPLYPPGMRLYANAVKEIRNWLAGNPGEIVMIDLENHIFEQGGVTADVRDPLAEYLGEVIWGPSLVRPGGSAEKRWPTRREMLARKRQVIVLDNANTDGNPARNPLAFKEKDAVGSFGEDWFAKNLRTYPDCPVENMRDGDNTFAILVEERELGSALFGQLNANDVRAAVECNYNLIVLDKFAVVLPGGALDVPDFKRHESSVWGWEKFDSGQHGDCAILRDPLDPAGPRWNSEDCARPAHYACALPRSESGLDPVDWTDPAGDYWRVTTATGRWADGFATCAAEFPGYVFGVPVNGYQNRRLIDGLPLPLAQAPGFETWLNYRQHDGDDQWAIERSSENTKPVADAGPDKALECAAPLTLATLDGSKSRDGDGDPLTYTWTGPTGTLTGPVVNVALPLGTHTFLLTVTDGKGGSDADSKTIRVVDNVVPFIKGIRFSPTMLAPVNDQLVRVTAQIDAFDVARCDAGPPSITLVSILFPGATTPLLASDVQRAQFGTNDRDFQLRATKPAKGQRGRMYTVTYRATDRSGNFSERSAQVGVGSAETIQPAADAGPDQNLECSGTQTPVALDGSRSRDGDGAALTYTWTGPFGTLTGPAVTTALPLGTHPILLTVTDGIGVSTDSTSVTVGDTKPPFIKGIRLSPGMLGPINDQLIDVSAEIDVLEPVRCEAEPPSISLVSITFPGATPASLASDVQQAQFGTDDRDFQLRATQPSAKGRTYIVTYRATDRSGNFDEASTQISVGDP